MLNFVPDLQQGFQHNVVLMVVGDQGVVNDFGQVSVAIASHAVGMVVTDQGVNENRHLLGLDQDAGMAKVADTDAISGMG